MFDLDVIIPVCNKFAHRLEDFKKYGILNPKGRSIRINAIESGERVEGVDRGWRGDFEVRVVHNDSPEYVANLYRFYLSLDPANVECRWLIRLDDDSCTDIDGLLTNLDKFYGSDGEFYLGNLHTVQNALNGYEGMLYSDYKSLLGDYEPFGNLLKTEIECGVMSRGAIRRVLSNEASRRLIEKRSSMSGGYGDCVVALACTMAGVWPVDCPFITHRPLLQDFSLLGGVRNHIHMISRADIAENFMHRASPEMFTLLTKVADGSPNELERSMFGKRLLCEGSERIHVVVFEQGYKAEVKLDRRKFNWYADGDEVVVIEGENVFLRLKSDGRGGFSGQDLEVSVVRG